jgi:hypothetical protein
MSGPTPLLDVFKRGEAPRDVRLQAAQGSLAPRPHEQLALLVLLADDPDPEIREIADRTMKGIPVEKLAAFLARSDVADPLRAFFAARGDVPAAAASEDDDTPLVDADPSSDAAAAGDSDVYARRVGVAQQVAKMGFSERLKAAV